MQKAYFEDIRNHIIPLLQVAKEDIIIAMAWFTSAELFSEIMSCLKRNVNIQLVLLDSPTNFMYYAPDFNEFISAGGILRIANESVGFMHHKFCVIDNSIAITGSYNWTYYAENRNIENILVTDEPSVINLFKQEFKRLSEMIECSSSSPRLSWVEIEGRTDVDYGELNYEIERICQVLQKPIKKVIETKTIVQIVDTKMKPLATRNIGVLTADGDDEIFSSILNANNLLPYSIKRNFWLDSIGEKTFYCKFLWENPNDKFDFGLIQEADLLQIAQGTLNENLKIEMTMTLDVDGSLRIDIYCPENRKKMIISALDSNLVRYE